jgi:hypothetical protein
MVNHRTTSGDATSPIFPEIASTRIPLRDFQIRPSPNDPDVLYLTAFDENNPQVFDDGWALTYEELRRLRRRAAQFLEDDRARNLAGS